MARVLLVHWKPDEAGPHVAALRKAGHDVRVVDPDGMPPLRALTADRPGAIVIDLGRLPSHGRAVATALRQQEATRDVPLLFVEGDPGKTARVKALLPDAVYTTWRGLAGALRRALRARPAAKPVVREFGLAASLVDCKIAAIDAVWSGLCFARRKARREDASP